MPVWECDCPTTARAELELELEPSSSRLRSEAGPAAPSPGGRQFRQERWEGPYKMPYSVIASQTIFSASEKFTASGILLCEIDFGHFGVAR